MMAETKILAMAGSMRRESLNKILCALGAQAATKAGAEVTLLDLRDYVMPLYDGDVEERLGLPDNAKALKETMKEHDAFLFASPEYNSSVSGVFKNAIDWCTRPEPGEPPLIAFRGKVAAIMSASPGKLGGLRGLFALRSLLQNLGVIVVPDMIAVSQANKAFTDAGELRDAKLAESVVDVAGQLVDLTRRLGA
jgi:chromate reductase, NAD(P)H dehydrogenase (quinone)